MRNILFIIMIVGLLVVVGCSNQVADDNTSNAGGDNVSVGQTLADQIVPDEGDNFTEIGEMI